MWCIHPEMGVRSCPDTDMCNPVESDDSADTSWSYDLFVVCQTDVVTSLSLIHISEPTRPY